VLLFFLFLYFFIFLFFYFFIFSHNGLVKSIFYVAKTDFLVEEMMSSW
jgi:hypothetical protein